MHGLPTVDPWVLRVLRIVVSVALVLVALRALDLHAIADVAAGVRPGEAAVGLAMLTGGQLVCALRWRALARKGGLDASRSWFAAAYLRGCFYNTFLPTGMGGDAVRVMLSRRLGRTAAAVRAVAADRLWGLAALAVVSMLLAPLTPQLVDHAGVRAAVAGVGGATALGVVVVALARRLPAWVGWSLVYVAVWTIGVWLLADALHVGLPLTATPAVVLVAGIAVALPLSVGGLGTREAAFVLACAPLGVATEPAVALGIAFGIALAAIGLLGAVVRLPGPNGRTGPCARTGPGTHSHVGASASSAMEPIL
jgi:glycosyltransferase 2 family protein